MIKYFAGHTDITFSKTLRSTHDHSGLSESRVASHNSHFGFRWLNKMDFNLFPFKFTCFSLHFHFYSYSCSLYVHFHFHFIVIFISKFTSFRFHLLQ